MAVKIKSILAKETVQRLIYGLILLLWTVVMWDRLINFPLSISSLKISYLTLYMIPAIILLIQIIRNNKLFWLVIFGLFTGYILVSLFSVLWDIIEKNGNHVKVIDWSFKEIIFLILYFAILGLIDWVIYHLKPKRWI